MGEGRGEDFGDGGQGGHGGGQGGHGGGQGGHDGGQGGYGGGQGGEQGGNGGEAAPKSRLCIDVQDCDGSGIKKTQHFEDKISQTEDFICQCRCLQLSC